MVYGDGTLGEMVYEMVHQERWLMGRCYIRRDGLWEMVHEEIWIMGDGTLGEMVYGRWYIRRDGTLGEMINGKMAHQERWFMGRCYIRRDGLWEMVH